MNIQIFGTKKCNDTKKAQRFFKERGIKFQFIDMMDKGMSKGEFQSVAKAHGGIDGMINPDCKDKDALARVNYMADKLETLLENQQVIKTPIVIIAKTNNTLFSFIFFILPPVFQLYYKSLFFSTKCYL